MKTHGAGMSWHLLEMASAIVAKGGSIQYMDLELDKDRIHEKIDSQASDQDQYVKEPTP